MWVQAILFLLFRINATVQLYYYANILIFYL